MVTLFYDTNPWEKSETNTESGIEVRFTKKGTKLFVILLGLPNQKETIKDLKLEKGQKISLLGKEGYLKWRGNGTSTVINFPKNITLSHAVVLEVTK